ncbi:MAG: tyrosine-protein phosphatase [Phycisphaerales bacterium]|nr:MAG: tyrosine-protein phosphatase [Phycisphaerales bacterium]
MVAGRRVGAVRSMNSVKTTRHSGSRRQQALLPVTIGVMVLCLAYYLLFFVAGANFREVVSGRVYRSAQPSPGQLRQWMRRYGIRTVINLRGDAGQITEDERAVADELGVEMIAISLSANRIPPKDRRAQLIRAIETAEQPILIHCAHGVDRAGTASALAAMAIGKMDYEKAKWHAYVPPGPWKRKQGSNYVHISDMLRLYESFCKRNGLDTNSWHQLKQWIIDADI